MKILVLSDSHSSLAFMRKAISTVEPDAVVHLGDHYDDGETMAEQDAALHQHLMSSQTWETLMTFMT